VRLDHRRRAKLAGIEIELHSAPRVREIWKAVHERWKATAKPDVKTNAKPGVKPGGQPNDT